MIPTSEEAVALAAGSVAAAELCRNGWLPQGLISGGSLVTGQWRYRFAESRGQRRGWSYSTTRPRKCTEW